MKTVLIFIILAFCFIFSNLKYSKYSLDKNKINFDKISIVLMFLLLLLIQVVQETTGHNDVFVYKENYERFANWSFDAFFAEWQDLKDPFYYFVGFLFLKLGFTFELFKICINIFFIFSVYKLVSKYSNKPYISIIVFVVLGSYNFSFTGLRQALAMAILMYSYKYLIEKKPLKFFAIVLIATAFHSSAIIFLIVYFAYYLKQSIFSLAVLTIGGVVAIVNSRALVSFYLNFVDATDLYGEYLEKEDGLSISGVIILVSILLFALIFTYGKKWKAKDPKLTHLLLISVVFRILSVVWFAEFFRLSMYFSIFDMLLIADACTTTIGEGNFLPRIKTVAVSGVLCLYYLLFI